MCVLSRFTPVSSLSQLVVLSANNNNMDAWACAWAALPQAPPSEQAFILGLLDAQASIHVFTPCLKARPRCALIMPASVALLQRFFSQLASPGANRGQLVVQGRKFEEVVLPWLLANIRCLRNLVVPLLAATAAVVLTRYAGFFIWQHGKLQDTELQDSFRALRV